MCAMLLRCCPAAEESLRHLPDRLALPPGFNRLLSLSHMRAARVGQPKRLRLAAVAPQVRDAA
eukprot:scaffold104407_cov41-Phaeocystis_antarctica.AAC.2